jgi:AraC-like DNA-binding protein
MGWQGDSEAGEPGGRRGGNPLSVMGTLSIPDLPGGSGSAPSSSLSNVSRFTSSDFGAVRDHMCNLFRPHAILPRASMSARGLDSWLFELGQANLGSEMTLTTVSYDREVEIKAPPLDDFFVMQFTLCGRCAVSLGEDEILVEPGKVCVLNPTRPVLQKMSADYRQMAVKIDRSLIEGLLSRELGHELRNALEFELRPTLVQGRAATLARTMSALWNDLQMSESGYATKRVQKRFQETAAALLLTALPHNYSLEFERSGDQAAPYFVRRAEDFMHEQASEDIELDEICAAAGVSLRTLQNGFRRFRDTTPMAYLKSIRLETARKALAQSCQTGASVTEIAFECGFTHLSKFAQDYKQRFGETPSATARRGFI